MGAVGVMRYLGHDVTGKVITRDELHSLQAAGLGVGLVFEDGASRALAGAAAGRDDAAFAVLQALALGIPQGNVIYVAVDTDPTGHHQVIGAYLGAWQGYLQSHGYLPGVYGGYDVMGLVTDSWYRWQTRAWSAGRRWPGLNLYQYDGGPSVDLNDAALQWGQITYPIGKIMQEQNMDEFIVTTPVNGSFLYRSRVNGSPGDHYYDRISLTGVSPAGIAALVAAGLPHVNLGAADADALARVTL